MAAIVERLTIIRIFVKIFSLKYSLNSVEFNYLSEICISEENCLLQCLKKEGKKNRMCEKII